MAKRYVRANLNPEQVRAVEVELSRAVYGLWELELTANPPGLVIEEDYLEELQKVLPDAVESVGGAATTPGQKLLDAYVQRWNEAATGKVQ